MEPRVQPLSTNQELIDVNFQVEEKSTDTANMSAGYSQRDGLLGSVGVAMNNFRGRGQILSADLTFGRWFSSQSVSFTEPWLFGTPTLAGVRVFRSKRAASFFPFDWSSYGVSLRLGRRLRWPDDFFRIEWNVEVSESEVSNVRTSVDPSYFLVGKTATAVSL